MVAAPLLPLWLRYRAGRGKEIAARLPERRGFGCDRPEGLLIWLHAASVGETLSLLPLLGALARARPEARFLITTATVTGAAMLAARLPPDLAARSRHRFLALDVPGWVARFLDGWRPDAAVFVESEIWPNLIAAAAARGIPLGLVNARMSARSGRRWARLPGFAASLFGAFRLVAAQTATDAARLRRLGAAGVVAWGNLKAAAEPLPADPEALAEARRLLGGRPVLLAASTHPGEEALILRALPALRVALPDLLLLLVPRHPDRGAEVAAAAGGAPRRALGQGPGAGPGAGSGAGSVWVADTMGELGIWFRLAQAAVIGGSLVPKGGHNPLEAAQLRCPILFGPHMENFAEVAARLLALGGAIQVPDAAALAPAAIGVLTGAGRAAALSAAAVAVADDAAGLPERLAAEILGWLPVPLAQPGDRARTFSGQAFSGQAFSGQAFSGQAFSGQAFSGQAFSGQAFSGQAFSGQAFSGQAASPDDSENAAKQ
ncbi:3-deoxy-D-manno-octulosonic-acid transferase [Humitalea rosea]|uniref:3-deoxy-D-manno-octulosonic acid transferase n=2 Tax=Humitalea rosea TaxID=990373 RepID=A0A2W7IJK6_9PROT|nr:3-deoxy-D-manno-octulosonic-acid transferase [Humitalea rosea]